MSTWNRSIKLRSNCRYFFFQAEDGIRDIGVTGVQTCALPICRRADGVQVRYLLLDALHVFNLVDARQLGRDGLPARGLARRLVHAGRVVVAYLLLDRAGLRLRVLRGLFENLVQGLPVRSEERRVG